MNSMLKKTRKRILICGLALISTVAFAQKKEMRRAERAVSSEKFSEAITHLNEAEGLLSGADNSMKADFYKLKGDALLGLAGRTNYAKAKEAGEAYLQAIELKPGLKLGLDVPFQNLRSVIVNSAVEDQNNENFKEAAEKMKVAYDIVKDPSDLYFAGMFMINAQNYDSALEYFETLLDMGYTGETTEYVATDKDSQEVIPFSDKESRDFALKTGQYINPDTRKTPSKRGELLRFITLIYREKGDSDKVKEVLKSARLENPDDRDLIMLDAEYSYEEGDIQNYNKLIRQMIASDPENPDLFFNLGVRSQEMGEKEDAITYYERAIELDPKKESPMINLAILKLSAEEPLIEEMNSLGMSAADNRRYEELKAQREDIYRDVVPLLERANKINPKNIEVIRTLMNIYGQLGDDAKVEEMRAKLSALGAE